MTIEELKVRENLSKVSVYHAKDDKGNWKFDKEGNPLYKFVGERIDLSAPLFGYVSKELGRAIELGEEYKCTVSQAVIDDKPVYMIICDSALTTW